MTEPKWEHEPTLEISDAMVNVTLYHKALRVVVGYCPKCGALLMVFNDGSSWPPVICREECGWKGGIPEISMVHLFDPTEVVLMAKAL